MTQLDRVAFEVVQSALARAPKHNTDSTGTDYLLRQILDGPMDIWDELKSVKRALAAPKPSAKAVGYLMAVSATGGEAARWETTEHVVPGSADSSAAEDLREAAWSAAQEGPPLVQWTGDFVATIELSFAYATRRGSEVADIRDLAAALVSGHRNRAIEALEKGGAEVASAAERVAALPSTSEGIRTPSLAPLERTGALAGATKKRGIVARFTGRSQVATFGTVVAEEAVRQAVRTGSQTVDAEHVRAALASIQQQVTLAEGDWSEGELASVKTHQAQRANVLVPASWPNSQQELPRRIAPLESFHDVLAVVA